MRYVSLKSSKKKQCFNWTIGRKHVLGLGWHQ